MQLHPTHFVAAGICGAIALLAFQAAEYYQYYGAWAVMYALDLVALGFICAAVSFALTAVNVEVWDLPQLRKL
jgi:hypothetical protein